MLDRGEIVKKVQKIKFVYCPKCGKGQYSIPRLSKKIGEVICESCGEIFDSTKEVRESQ